MLLGTVAASQAALWPGLIRGAQDQGRKSTDPPVAAKGKLGQDLFMAIDRRNLEGIRALIKQGADPNSRNGLEMTPLYIAGASHQLDAMKELIAAGAKPDSESPYGTPITFSAMSAHLDGVKLLISKGVDVNYARGDGMTPLMFAANAGHPGVVAELIQNKADVNAQDDEGVSALAFAARQGNDGAGQVLLGSGAKVDSVDLEKQTPLMEATMTGHSSFAQMLLKAGANPNAKDAKGRTALMLAASYSDNPELIKALLAAGADPKATNAEGRNPAAIASARGFKASASLLGAPIGKIAAKRTAKEAIPISLELLQDSMVEFGKNTNCISCHQEGLGRMVTAEAKARGFKTNPELQKTHLMKLGGMLSATKPLHEGALKDPEVMKQVPLIEMNEVTSGYAWLMNGMVSQNDPVTPEAGAMAMVMGRQQTPDGFWSFSLPRAPMQSSFFTMTALAVRALNAYAPKSDAKEVAERTAKARAWLAATPAKSSEDRAFKLLGLLWSVGLDKDRKAAITEIRKDQRPDGGWSQTPTSQSDAYATGQALYALNQAGVPATDAAYQKGVDFLLRTQDADGSWFVYKRALPANNYFDAGFPHGQSQYASFNGTSWATLALMGTVPRK